MYQIQRVLLGSRSDFSVVFQIAFCLGIKPEELTSPSLTQKQIQQEQDSHYMKDTAPVDWVQLDTDTAPIFPHLAQTIMNTGSNVGDVRHPFCIGLIRMKNPVWWTKS